MLSKIEYNSSNLGTDQIIKYCKNNKNVIKIQDNLIDSLLVKTKENTYLFNYKNNKKYFYNKIQIEFNYNKIIKQIDSFDQNNIIIANKLRKYVLSLCKNNELSLNISVNKNSYLPECKVDVILGIGGEYYLYFQFIKANVYIGISNHQSIINDANYNASYSINYLVDYNNYNEFPNINNTNIILVNLFNININVIKYINTIKFDKLIIISCSLSDNRLLLLKENFKIKTIKTFQNFNGFIKVFQLVKKC
jgi:hypothetical protein